MGHEIRRIYSNSSARRMQLQKQHPRTRSSTPWPPPLFCSRRTLHNNVKLQRTHKGFKHNLAYHRDRQRKFNQSPTCEYDFKSLSPLCAGKKALFLFFFQASCNTLVCSSDNGFLKWHEQLHLALVILEVLLPDVEVYFSSIPQQK